MVIDMFVAVSHTQNSVCCSIMSKKCKIYHNIQLIWLVTQSWPQNTKKIQALYHPPPPYVPLGKHPILQTNKNLPTTPHMASHLSDMHGMSHILHAKFFQWMPCA